MPAWDDIPESERPFQRRLMEVAAGFAEHVDVQVGRAARRDRAPRLRPTTRWSSTSGATTARRAKARTARSASCWRRTASRPPSTCTSRRSTTLGGLDVLGTPEGRQPVPRRHGPGRAARRTQGMKLLASHLGGTRNPMAVRWPAKIAARRDARARSSITATTSCRRSTSSSGSPRRGSSTASRRTRSTASASPTRSTTPDAPGRLRTQYFEIMGSRAIYHDGWMASAFGPRLPWVPGLPPGIQTGRPTRTSGSSTTSTRTGRRPTTSPPRCPRSSRR